MGDPYRMYAAHPLSERTGNPFPSFPGFLSQEASSLNAHRPWSSADVRYNPDILQNDLLPSRAGEYPMNGNRVSHPPPVYPMDNIRRNRPPTHPLNDIRGMHPPEPGLGRPPIGASIGGYPSPMKDPSFVERRPDIPPDVSPSLYDIDYERQNSHKTTSDLPTSAMESSILFVDGLPTNCSRREVGHLFRPFIGYTDVKVVHKEPRRSGDKPLVLCFVDFMNSKCALTAMEALQGYKFDDKNPSSGVLQISFAHFPLRRSSDLVHQ